VTTSGVQPLNTKALNTKVRCVDCIAEGITSPRKIVAGVRKPRCHTHERQRRQRAREQAHGRMVQRTYSITAEQYQKLYEAQGGKCAIAGCRATGKARKLAVDHDHDTGEVRGLLCGPHNIALGRDGVVGLVSMLQYLHDPPARRILRDQA